MNEGLKAVLFGLICWGIVFFIYYFVFLKSRYKNYIAKDKKKKKQKSNLFDLIEFAYLISRFKLDINKIDILYCLRWFGIIDAFIISFTATVIYYIPWHIAWKFLVGFVMLFGLIYAIYELLGRHLVRKGWSKDGI